MSTRPINIKFYTSGSLRFFHIPPLQTQTLSIPPQQSHKW